MTITIHNYQQLELFLFFYRSFLCKKVQFCSTIKEPEMSKLIEALNKKKRRERITYVLEEACNYIDNYYQNKNVCKFKKGVCVCHREGKRAIKNGCCYKCRYQSIRGCTTKNVACKLFLCSYAKRGIIPIDEDNIRILKILTKKERYILRYDYFSTIDEVVNDLCFGFIISGIRIEYRYLKMKKEYKKRKRYAK